MVCGGGVVIGLLTRRLSVAVVAFVLAAGLSGCGRSVPSGGFVPASFSDMTAPVMVAVDEDGRITPTVPSTWRVRI